MRKASATVHTDNLDLSMLDCEPIEKTVEAIRLAAIEFATAAIKEAAKDPLVGFPIEWNFSITLPDGTVYEPSDGFNGPPVSDPDVFRISLSFSDDDQLWLDVSLLEAVRVIEADASNAEMVANSKALASHFRHMADIIEGNIK
jgi:hypothetical protein